MGTQQQATSMGHLLAFGTDASDTLFNTRCSDIYYEEGTQVNQGSTYSTRSEVKLSTSGPAVLYAVINVSAFPENVKVSVQHEVRFDDPAEPDETIVKDVSDQAISWMDLSEVETLAEIFCSQRVDVFKVIVEMLGKVHRQQQMLQALLVA
jgi:hypothetical protein